MAGVSSRRRSRFSAKLSLAAGKKRAPGMWSPSTSTGPWFPAPRASATTPQKSQTLTQNFSNSAIETWCSAAKSGRRLPQRRSTSAAKAARFDASMRSAEGRQSGADPGCLLGNRLFVGDHGRAGRSTARLAFRKARAISYNRDPQSAPGSFMQKPIDLLRGFLQLEAASGLILIFAAVAALLLDNSPLAWLYDALLSTPLQIREIGRAHVCTPV